MGLPKRQHYVPQVLLRGFADEAEQLWAFDKWESRAFRTSIKNVVAQKGFYNVEVDDAIISLEPALADLETQVAPILKKIREARSLSGVDDSERELLALFALVQQQRTVNYRERYRKMVEDANAFARDIGFSPQATAQLADPTDEDIQQFGIRAIATAHQYVPLLLSKTLLLIAAESPEAFLLGDNPIAMQNSKSFGPYGNIGLAVPWIEIYLPVSSRLTLGWFSDVIAQEYRSAVHDARMQRWANPLASVDLWNRAAPMRDFLSCAESGNPLTFFDGYVLRLNSLQVMFSERYVLSHSGDFELVKEMLERDGGVRRGPRYQVG